MLEPEDPEITLERMKDTARDAANDLIPVLMEKAINGKTKDALNIFEAFADRAGFNRPAVPPPTTLNQFNLNFSPQDMQNMLSGLKTITSSQGSSQGPPSGVLGSERDIDTDLAGGNNEQES